MAMAFGVYVDRWIALHLFVAGMLTLAAAWSYRGHGDPIEGWGAHAVLPTPDALLQWLELA